MQSMFGRAGLRRRGDLGASQIGLEEFVSDHHAARFIPVEQVVSAGQPEIATAGHGITVVQKTVILQKWLTSA